MTGNVNAAENIFNSHSDNSLTLAKQALDHVQKAYAATSPIAKMESCKDAILICKQVIEQGEPYNKVNKEAIIKTIECADTCQVSTYHEDDLGTKSYSDLLQWLRDNATLADKVDTRIYCSNNPAGYVFTADHCHFAILLCRRIIKEETATNFNKEAIKNTIESVEKCIKNYHMTKNQYNDPQVGKDRYNIEVGKNSYNLNVDDLEKWLDKNQAQDQTEPNLNR